MCSPCFHSQTFQFHSLPHSITTSPPTTTSRISLDNWVVCGHRNTVFFFPHSDLMHWCLDITNYCPFSFLHELYFAKSFIFISWLLFFLPFSWRVPNGFTGCPLPCQPCFICIHQNVSPLTFLLKTKMDGAVHTEGSNFCMKVDVQIGQPLDRRTSLQFNVFVTSE